MIPIHLRAQLKRDLRELTQLEGYYRKAAMTSIGSMSQLYLPHLITKKTPPFHKAIANLLTSQTTRSLIVAPRGFAKSTLASVLLPLYLALQSHKPPKIRDSFKIGGGAGQQATGISQGQAKINKEDKGLEGKKEEVGGQIEGVGGKIEEVE